MNDISNRIIKTEEINWREVEWLQGNLKELSDKQFGKLKQSLIKNSFIMPFNVWQNGKLWILDGHHRQKAMLELEKEGHSIPDKLPANFIDCKDSKEAKKLVLIYSSIYARASEESLKEFITAADLNFDDLKLEIDLPDMNLENLLKSKERAENAILHPKYEVVIECADEDEQRTNFEELMALGKKCRILTL